VGFGVGGRWGCGWGVLDVVLAERKVLKTGQENIKKPDQLFCF